MNITKLSRSDQRIWEDVESAQKLFPCRCELQAGMTWEELLSLKTGCKKQWVCPVLDKYRRLVQKTRKLDDESEDS